MLLGAFKAQNICSLYVVWENDLNLSVRPCVGCRLLPSAAYLLQLKSGPGSAAASPSGTAAERRRVVPKAYCLGSVDDAGLRPAEAGPPQ